MATKKKQAQANTLRIVHNEEAIARFVDLFKYAQPESKPSYLAAFLALIVADPTTYEGSSSSRTLKSSKGETDAELNGFDLFFKYANYKLDSSKQVLGYADFTLETLIDPTPDVYRLRGNKGFTILDQLLILLAVNLHQHEFYTEAGKVYEQYLTQHSKEISSSMDCIFVRYYLAMAQVAAVNYEAAQTAPREMDLAKIEDHAYDLGYDDPKKYALCRELYDELSEYHGYHAEAVEVATKFQGILARIPEPLIDNLSELRFGLKELDAALAAIAHSDIRAMIEEEVHGDRAQLVENIATLEEAQKAISQALEGSVNVYEGFKAYCGYKASSHNYECLKEGLVTLREYVENFEYASKQEHLETLDGLKTRVDRQGKEDIAAIERAKRAAIAKEKRAAAAAAASGVFNVLKYIFYILIFGLIAIAPAIVLSINHLNLFLGIDLGLSPEVLSLFLAVFMIWFIVQEVFFLIGTPIARHRGYPFWNSKINAVFRVIGAVESIPLLVAGFTLLGELGSNPEPTELAPTILCLTVGGIAAIHYLIRIIILLVAHDQIGTAGMVLLRILIVALVPAALYLTYRMGAFAVIGFSSYGDACSAHNGDMSFFGTWRAAVANGDFSVIFLPLSAVAYSLVSYLLVRNNDDVADSGFFKVITRINTVILDIGFGVLAIYALLSLALVLLYCFCGTCVAIIDDTISADDIVCGIFFPDLGIALATLLVAGGGITLEAFKWDEFTA